MANERLNGLALAYIHKPTEIDSTSVLKRWDASGHRRIALAFTNNKRRAKNFHISNCYKGRSLLLLIVKVSDFLVLQV